MSRFDAQIEHWQAAEVRGRLAIMGALPRSTAIEYVTSRISCALIELSRDWEDAVPRKLAERAVRDRLHLDVEIDRDRVATLVVDAWAEATGVRVRAPRAVATKSEEDGAALAA